MPTLWARTATYESISLGDELPILVKYESEEALSAGVPSIAGEGAAEGVEAMSKDRRGAPPVEEQEAKVTAYVTELLEKSFPRQYLQSPGAGVEVLCLGRIIAGDTITLTGTVTAKWEVEGRGMIECQVVCDGGRGRVLASATASIPFPMDGSTGATEEDPGRR